MKVELRKRKLNNLRKIIKVDELGNHLSFDPMFVKIDEVENNVIQEGTAITPEIINKVNWRDESKIEFALLDSNALPSAKEGVVQIVSKQNGEVWCIPSTQAPYPLGNVDLSQYMTKSGKVYARGKSLEYFNLDKEAKIFSTRTRIGAIPVRVEDEAIFNDGTYLEFNKDRMELYHQSAIFKITSEGKINLESPSSSSLNLRGGNIHIGSNNKISLQAAAINMSGDFSISTQNTSVEETSDHMKFNCHTNLTQASYGNQNFRLQFYPDYVRIMHVQPTGYDKKIFQLNTDGTILINDVITPLQFPLGFSSRETSGVTWGNIGKVGRFITDWKTSSGGEIMFREGNNKLFVGIDGVFYQNEGMYKVVDENSVNQFIQTYFDNNFERLFLEHISKYEQKQDLFSGNSQEVGYTLFESTKKYKIDFASYSNSTLILTMIFKGTELQSKNPSITDSLGNIYEVNQFIATDDQYGDYIEVLVYNSSHNYLGRAYIRNLYELR